MTKYYMDHPEKEDYEIEIPKKIVDKINRDHIVKTFYWSVGIFCTIIGFLLGVLAK